MATIINIDKDKRGICFPSIVLILCKQKPLSEDELMCFMSC